MARYSLYLESIGSLKTVSIALIAQELAYSAIDAGGLPAGTKYKGFHSSDPGLLVWLGGVQLIFLVFDSPKQSPWWLPVQPPLALPRPKQPPKLICRSRCGLPSLRRQGPRTFSDAINQFEVRQSESLPHLPRVTYCPVAQNGE
jgi:hypothetical protein